MQNIFDTLINSYIEKNVGIDANFLSESLSKQLKVNLLQLYKDKHFLAAGVGNNAVLSLNKLVRSDLIYWLDRKHNNIHENSFLDLMDNFIAYLNNTCYTGITGYEFHYTMYEKGSFYKKHIDQFQNNKSRAFSMIMYLNVDWKIEDGGELCLYHKDYQENVSPMNGKCIFFKSSELAHEVLITHQQRLSITGWLKTD